MSSDSNDYMLSRGFAANGRTTLQHYLFKDGLDYLLHPCIPTKKPNLIIAEIGVGTGIWLIELARTLPPSAQLDGLDISFSQCPPKEWLPANISWITHDVLSEPPSSLLEKYDIIHVQLFITILRDGNPVPMLLNLMKMLKPDGYIQWAEWDVKTWEIIRVPSAPSLSNDELEKLREWTSTLGKTKPGPSFISSGWITRLPTTFAENGLSSIVVDRRKFAPEIATLLLDTWMMASQEISANVLDKLGEGRGDVARALIEEVGRNRGNTAFNLQRVVTIGKKGGLESE